MGERHFIYSSHAEDPSHIEKNGITGMYTTPHLLCITGKTSTFVKTNVFNQRKVITFQSLDSRQQNRIPNSQDFISTKL